MMKNSNRTTTPPKITHQDDVEQQVLVKVIEILNIST